MRELIGYTRPELVLQAVVMTVNYVVLLLLSLASPRTAHRLVGYTMEESSVVLTHMVNDIDTAKVDERTLPDIVTKYYRFVETTTTSKSGGGVATANNGSKQAAASETTAADVPRVACLRTLALLIRSDHISLAEWHHAMADELDEKKRDAGAGSSFS
jgi:hypothetical protein